MDYGNLHLRINEILQEKGISKNQICKDLDIPRTNFNKYCGDGVCRFLDFNVSNSRVGLPFLPSIFLHSKQNFQNDI